LYNNFINQYLYLKPNDYIQIRCSIDSRLKIKKYLLLMTRVLFIKNMACIIDQKETEIVT